MRRNIYRKGKKRKPKVCGQEKTKRKKRHWISHERWKQMQKYKRMIRKLEGRYE